MVLQELFEGLNVTVRLPKALGLSAAAQKDLRDWKNASTPGKYKLKPEVIEELKANPGLRKNSSYTVYRGLNFDEKFLKKNPNLAETLEEIKAGKFTHTWDRPSSWSLDREIALKFAKGGISKIVPDDKQFRGVLGVLLEATVHPSKVLFDTTLFKRDHLKYSHEDEVILDAGAIKTKIAEKFHD